MGDGSPGRSSADNDEIVGLSVCFWHGVSLGDGVLWLQGCKVCDNQLIIIPLDCPNEFTQFLWLEGTGTGGTKDWDISQMFWIDYEGGVEATR